MASCMQRLLRNRDTRKPPRYSEPSRYRSRRVTPDRRALPNHSVTPSRRALFRTAALSANAALRGAAASRSTRDRGRKAAPSAGRGEMTISADEYRGMQNRIRRTRAAAEYPAHGPRGPAGACGCASALCIHLCPRRRCRCRRRRTSSAASKSPFPDPPADSALRRRYNIVGWAQASRSGVSPTVRRPASRTAGCRARTRTRSRRP